MTNPQKIFISLLIVIIFNFSIFFLLRFVTKEVLENKQIASSDMLQDNSISFTILNNGKKVEDFLISTPNELLKTELVIKNNNRESVNYSLITFLNFKQTDMEIFNKIHERFNFTVSSKTTMNIPINLSVGKNVGEIDFILIPNPDTNIVSAESSFENLDVITLRYFINNYNSQHIYNEFKEADFEKEYQGEAGNILYVRKNLAYSNTFDWKVGQNESTYVHVGNPTDQKSYYALITLVDWKQTPLIANEYVSFISLYENTWKAYKLVNESSENHILQLIAIPMPYKYFPNSPLNFEVLSSPRILIEGSNK